MFRELKAEFPRIVTYLYIVFTPAQGLTPRHMLKGTLWSPTRGVRKTEEKISEKQNENTVKKNLKKAVKKVKKAKKGRTYYELEDNIEMKTAHIFVRTKKKCALLPVGIDYILFPRRHYSLMMLYVGCIACTRSLC